jgi:hypothetical protein
MKTKFAIGVLVQWYESSIIEYYIDSLKDAIERYDGEVIVDVCIIADTTLEKPTSQEDKELAIEKIDDICEEAFGYNYIRNEYEKLYTIADYRREFNDKYCTEADVLVWGESDMLVPKQSFVVLDHLHQNVDSPKYLATFSICKMWDDSWKPLEHPEFTDKPFIEMDTKNWWSLRYTMSKEEMNRFNDKVEDIDVSIISPHKFNGCGLVISSEVIKAGVNIPKSVFFIHEDTAFMMMTNKVLGNIPQYHFKNILVVHNRKHPDKRTFVKGEENLDKTNPGAQREVHNWYTPANKMCEQNCYKLFDPNFKPFTWKDVFDSCK